MIKDSGDTRQYAIVLKKMIFEIMESILNDHPLPHHSNSLQALHCNTQSIPIDSELLSELIKLID